MTSVVTDACIGCRYGDCVEVCPVDAFRVGPNFVVIDPAVCVNCTTCVIVCPVGAIVPDYELQADQHSFKALNRDLSKVYPRASGPVPPLPDADEHAFETNKRSKLL
ncbi:4Fe-4S binding protein [Pusillimonas sp. T7-7]|uniref:4Fe-4S binding protein n=1 Tax=Pusillimonas sp. (strain T7-7) TaxID=1007105 RepID=UPI0005A039DB|nr:4Fe-4S binding protein [Pusillimonas sp. T7-7]